MVVDPVMAVLLSDPPNDGFEQIIVSHHHLPRLTVASSILAAAMIVAIFVSKSEGFDKGSAHMSLFLATRGEMRDFVIWSVGIMYDPAKGTTWWAGALRRRQEDKMQSYPY